MQTGQGTSEALTELPDASSASPEKREVSELAETELTETEEVLTSTALSAYEVGDHVYKCSGLLGFSQQHGVVLEASLGSADDDDDDIWKLKVVEFYPASNNKNPEDINNTDRQFCRIQLYEQSVRKPLWRTVAYQAGWWHRHTGRSGTCTATPRDGRGLVRARLEFLLHGTSTTIPPPFHWIRANSECLAVWCLTGTWATLQASSWLHVTAAGQVKSAATLATVAGSTSVTVPAAGLWGVLGFTTKASLLATNPAILPAICGYGVVTVGAPLWWLQRAKQAWKEYSIAMNMAYWEWAEHKTDFVELMMEWST